MSLKSFPLSVAALSMTISDNGRGAGAGAGAGALSLNELPTTGYKQNVV